MIAPPITQFRTGTEKALDPPPVGAFSFWSPFSIAIRDGAIGGGRVGLLRLGVSNARCRRQPRDCRSGTQLVAFRDYQFLVRVRRRCLLSTNRAVASGFSVSEDAVA